MSELSLKALAFLRSNTSKKSFIVTDLTATGFSLSEADQVIKELEKCGYIEVHHEWVSGSFSLI